MLKGGEALGRVFFLLFNKRPVGIYLRPICWHRATEWATSCLDQHGWKIVGTATTMQWLWQHLLQEIQTTETFMEKQSLPTTEHIQEEEEDSHLLQQQPNFFYNNHLHSSSKKTNKRQTAITTTIKEQQQDKHFQHLLRPPTIAVSATSIIIFAATSIFFSFSLQHLSLSHPFCSCTGASIWKPQIQNLCEGANSTPSFLCRNRSSSLSILPLSFSTQSHQPHQSTKIFTRAEREGVESMKRRRRRRREGGRLRK